MFAARAQYNVRLLNRGPHLIVKGNDFDPSFFPIAADFALRLTTREVGFQIPNNIQLRHMKSHDAHTFQDSCSKRQLHCANSPN